eukprot:Clim_evm99s225 gene=Clim_evmTU99s225
MVPNIATLSLQQAQADPAQFATLAKVDEDARTLFNPVKIGDFELSNRTVYAPLTRCRADPETLVQGDLNVEYYKQRATKGSLLITEGTIVERRAQGYPATPGIFNDDQVQGWKKIVDAVHGKGAVMVMQLWHCGRAAHSFFTKGETILSASDVPLKDDVYTPDGMKTPDTPRPMTKEDLEAVKESFRLGAQNAKKAGFDGVEIHNANGYLLDQFLQDVSNKRTDEYGGSIENRMRFPLEVVESVLEVFPASKVGIRISPSSKFLDMGDSNPEELFSAYVKALDKYGLAYIHVVEPRIAGSNELEGEPEVNIGSEVLSKYTSSAIIAAGGYKKESAAEVLRENDKVKGIAFGRWYLANPDFLLRLAMKEAPLNKYNRDLFYAPCPEGYIDYPYLKEDEVPSEFKDILSA